MSRLTDVWVAAPGEAAAAPRTYSSAPLPVVDWAGLGQTAPTPLPISYQGPNAPLPQADVVVLTWTSAEWSALDHVFLNSTTTRSMHDRDWQRNWHLYSRNAPPPPPGQTGSPLWGYYQMVAITTTGGKSLNVLLLKCDSHLAHAPWYPGLAQMVTLILQDARPHLVYSIGTAGGSREDLRLGDVVITNAAYLELQLAENTTTSPVNNQGFVATGAFPPATLLSGAEAKLLFDMTQVVTTQALDYAVTQLHEQQPDSASFELSDLLNSALSPDNLHDPRAVPMPGVQLLTTDFYYIADGSAEAARWAVLEMDDAVIAYVAGLQGVNYAFVRKISDPVLPSVTSSGVTIPPDVRKRWSGLIYEQFGLYTSFNGAITTWATIAAQG